MLAKFRVLLCSDCYLSEKAVVQLPKAIYLEQDKQQLLVLTMVHISLG